MELIQLDIKRNAARARVESANNYLYLCMNAEPFENIFVSL